MKTIVDYTFTIVIEFRFSRDLALPSFGNFQQKIFLFTVFEDIVNRKILK